MSIECLTNECLTKASNQNANTDCAVNPYSEHIPNEVYPLLKSLINAGRSEKRIAERAKFIGRMGEGIPNGRIAQEFGVENNSSRKGRERWLKSETWLPSMVARESDENQRKKAFKEPVQKILADQERCGTPMNYPPEQCCQVLQVELAVPSESGRPNTDGSGWELAEEVNRAFRGICENRSASKVGRCLRERAT